MVLLQPAETELISVTLVIAKSHVDIHCLCYHGDAHGPGCLQGTMLRSVARADSGSRVDSWGVCCCQIPCGSPCTVLPLSGKDKETTDDCRPIVKRARDRKGFCVNPKPYLHLHPPKTNNLDGKPLERTLQNCDGDAAV